MNLVLAQSSLGSFWGLVSNSGPVAATVLLILLFFSVFSWAIIYRKLRFYRRIDLESKEFYQRFRRAGSLSEVYRQCDRYSGSPLAGIFKSAYEELNHQLGRDQEGPTAAESRKLKDLQPLERTLRQAAQSEMTVLEESLPWLATTGSVTPFIGLFGTVVGIINAFQGLGQGAATTIQAVAPGISEALVATAAGLFAAIPAVIAYNHFVNRLKVFGVEMDDFSAEFLNTVERSLM